MSIIRLLDDFIGAVVDVFKLIGYFFAGVILVSIPLYGIVFLLEKITYYFF